MKKITLLKSMLLLCALVAGSGSVWAIGIYEKVTSATNLTDGTFLIVYEGTGDGHTGAVCFNGSLTTLDAGKNGISVTINEGVIVGSDDIDAATFSVNVTNKTLLSASGLYIGINSYGNGLKTSEDASTNPNDYLTIDDSGNAVIGRNFTYKSKAVTMDLRYNSSDGDNNLRFRFYKDKGQKAIALYKLTKERVAITSAGYATYVSDNALNYSGISGLTAYRATVSTNKVSFNTVTEVPAEEGVLLKGEAGNYDVPVIASASAITNDFVRGNDAAVPSSADGKYNFILNKVGDVVAFYAANGQTVAKNRAYLQSTTAPGAHGLEMSFDDSVTAITEIKGQKTEGRGEFYNLAGQRMAQPTKGLYIVNGKKVIIK